MPRWATVPASPTFTGTGGLSGGGAGRAVGAGALADAGDEGVSAAGGATGVALGGVAGAGAQATSNSPSSTLPPGRLTAPSVPGKPRAGRRSRGMVGRLTGQLQTFQLQTFRAVSTTSSSLRRWSSQDKRLPSRLEANPHCGLSARFSSGTYLDAS